MTTADADRAVRSQEGSSWSTAALGSLSRAWPALVGFAAVRLIVLLVFFAVASARDRDPWRILVSWDGQWYRSIAENGYGFVRPMPDGRVYEDYAFFPLYPILERGLSWTTGLVPAHAGLVISALASLIAAWGIFSVGEHVYGGRVATLTVMLWAALPISIVFSMAYTESLFTALAAWALYCVLTNRWVGAGLLAVAAGLTRPSGLAVVAAVVIPAMALLASARPAGRVAAGTRVRAAVGAALAPLGLVAYVGWVGYRKGTGTGYLDVTTRWGNGFDGGAAFASWTWRLLAGDGFAHGVGVVVALVLLALAGWLSVRQPQPLPLLTYSFVLVLIALSTEGFFGSKPRYLVPVFPLLLPLAAGLAGHRRAAFVVLAVMTVASAACGTYWLLGTGPP